MQVRSEIPERRFAAVTSSADYGTCETECGRFLREQARALGLDINVSLHKRPIDWLGYASLDMRCPHGRRWYAEPTREQIVEWAANDGRTP